MDFCYEDKSLKMYTEGSDYFSSFYFSVGLCMHSHNSTHMISCTKFFLFFDAIFVESRVELVLKERALEDTEKTEALILYPHSTIVLCI